MRNEVTLAQAAHVLNLIKDSGVDLEQMQDLNAGHLSALLRAAKEGHLPPLTEFRAALEKPVTELPAWTSISIGRYATSGADYLLDTVKRSGCWIQNRFDRPLLDEIDARMIVSQEQAVYDLVKASALQLGLDGILFTNSLGCCLKTEEAKKYLCRKAREHGLVPLTCEMMLELVLQKHDPYEVVVASELAESGSSATLDFVSIRKQEAKCEVSLDARVVYAKDTYVFARRKK